MLHRAQEVIPAFISFSPRAHLTWTDDNGDVDDMVCRNDNMSGQMVPEISVRHVSNSHVVLRGVCENHCQEVNTPTRHIHVRRRSTIVRKIEKT